MRGESRPLLSRPLDSDFALVTRSMPALAGYTGIIDTATFLDHVQAAAATLPSAEYFINICDNRYLFAVALMAVAANGRTSLLPPNANPATQVQLAERYPGTAVLHDGLEAAADVPSMDLAMEDLTGGATPAELPWIPADHVVAISFTSGSTGKSQPNPKSWDMLVAGAETNAPYYLGEVEPGASMLATVPGQHMWGLETSVTMPLRRPVMVADGRPLFPRDVQQALAALAEPRVLVTTPFHLRALVKSGLEFPPVARVLCATAPLDPALAAEVEALFAGELVEVYGCSEMGSMAWRRTSHEQDWRLFDDITLRAEDDGFVGNARHIPGEVDLQDLFEFTPTGRFRLAGRRSDLLDIAGKRGSLAEMNSVLMNCPGIVDGVVFQPPQSGAVPRLAALVVLEPETYLSDVTDHFRQHLDPVFVPRPILVVDRLRREANGKLTRVNTLAQFEQARNASRS